MGLLERMIRAVRGDWSGSCDWREAVSCLDFRVHQTRDIRRRRQRGKGWRNHVPEAAWEDRGRLPVIGRRGDQGDSLRRLDGSPVPVWISAFSERGISAEGAARQRLAEPRAVGSMGGARQVAGHRALERSGWSTGAAWLSIGRVWRELGWPGWIWLGRAVWQIRHWTKPPTVRNSGGRFVLNIGSKDALGKACQNQHDGTKAPTLWHISLPVLRTGSG